MWTETERWTALLHHTMDFNMDLSQGDVQLRLRKDEDFVALKRFDCSIRKLLERYPDGAPDRLIAQGLGVTEERVEAWYQEVIVKLRELMKVRDAEEG